MEQSDGYRQIEAARPGTARVEVKDFIAALREDDVGMSGDHRMDAGGDRFNVHLGKVVHHMNELPRSFDHFRLWQDLRPAIAVDIAPNCDSGSDVHQVVEDLRVSHVTSVEDELARAQGLQR